MMGISGDISCDFLRDIGNVLSIVYGVLRSLVCWESGGRRPRGGRMRGKRGEGGRKEYFGVLAVSLVDAWSLDGGFR